MTKPYCGTFWAHSSFRHKPTVLLHSCKTRPQRWQGAPHRAGQSSKTRTFVPVFYLWWRSLCEELLNVSAVRVLADGGLRGGFGSGRPGRLPVRSGFIRQRFNRGCSLHAPWHGYWNRKHVSTVHFDTPAVFYVCVIPADRPRAHNLPELIYINRRLCKHTAVSMFIL